MSKHNIEHVPHLATANSGPLHYLEKELLNKQVQIEAWFRQQWQKSPAHITCSVDLRNAGFKLAPVDTNLFPAGFNNIHQDLLPLCIQAVQTIIGEQSLTCKNILLIPETHSANPFYWQNIAAISAILNKAGYAARIGFIQEGFTTVKEIVLPSKDKLLLEPVIKVDNKIKLANFEPCLVLLNNDLSAGLPDCLTDIIQPIKPEPHLGWRKRLKSAHFRHYEMISNEFAALTDIDPWLICPLFNKCSAVNFITHEGQDCIIDNAAQLLEEIQKKYNEYDITHKPFVVIKADAGTYGMGVMMIDNAEQIRQLNRKQRNRMKMTKGHQQLDKVILQEGIYTFETWENAVAEPVIYMIGRFVVGGFYRVHTGLGRTDNLNAPGMNFHPLAFPQACNVPDNNQTPEKSPNRFYTYGVIARLAALAAARESIDLLDEQI